MAISVKPFGMADGRKVELYTFTNSNGIKIDITNYGCIIVRVFVPDKNGNIDDVVLGFDNLDDYLKGNPYFGSIIGRYSNRLENAEFTLNGVVYKLAANDGRNHLHGGIKGFDQKVWDPEITKENGVDILRLKYTSKDGEENYPGNLDVVVEYSLTDDNELVIKYEAVSDKDTIVNLTNHTYFNLSGHDNPSILKHNILINADKFTAINDECIPTGEIRVVDGTPMDFRQLKPIGPGLESGYEQIGFGKGYDHNYVLNNKDGLKSLAARVVDPDSGRTMEVYTTKPGIQFYTGNFLDGTYTGKGGVVYGRRCALCLETQYYPNSMKHKHFPSPVLRAGEKYSHTTIYKFGYLAD